MTTQPKFDRKYALENTEVHADFSTPPIRALRKMMYGKVPRHGTPDGPIPAMTPVGIVCKQVIHFLNYTGRWPK